MHKTDTFLNILIYGGFRHDFIFGHFILLLNKISDNYFVKYLILGVNKLAIVNCLWAKMTCEYRCNYYSS